MRNNIVNYISIGFFLIVLILILVNRMNSCDDQYKMSSEYYNDQQQAKEFLDKEVYQNTPLISYNYLVNYPDGPFSWGEWSWGSHCNTCKGDCNYSNIFANEKEAVNRNINN